jgi:diguanylate cyclase (GGDEF)-like protein
MSTELPEPPAPEDAQRIRRALETLAAGNRALLGAKSEADLLSDMCRVVVDVGGYRMAWVAYADRSAHKSVRAAAQAAVDGKPITEMPSWDETDARGRSAAGTTIRTGKPQVVRNIREDPAYAFVHRSLAERGLVSAVGLPLHVGGDVIGALLVYAREADAFDAAEVDLLSGLAENLSYGIASLRLRARQDEAHATIRRMALYDSLTGLPNRAQLKMRLAEAIAAAKQHNRPFPLLLLDVDRFRDVNEALGYEQGDRLLQQLGPRLALAVPEAKLVAYLGEDAFALLLDRGDAEVAQRVARRILEALAEPFDLTGFRADVRASIGIALYPGHGNQPDALILHADAAAQHAKRAFTGYHLYTSTASRDQTRRLALIGDLARAIDADELLLYCQPKIDVRSRLICGAEALVRWRHPKHGMIALDELIPLAQQTGLIRPLTYSVLGAALRQYHAWAESGMRVPVAVNVTMRTLRDPAFVDRLRGLMTTWGTPANALQLEITESDLMEDPPGTLDVLARLKRMDVKLYVDDFGTGYSSLAYLQRLPVDAIKIDQSFVRNMPASDESAKIVRSTIELAHNLELGVVAEGVETEPVLERLAALGCDAAQGYLISEPMPAERFAAWQARSPWRRGAATALQAQGARGRGRRGAVH